MRLRVLGSGIGRDARPGALPPPGELADRRGGLADRDRCDPRLRAPITRTRTSRRRPHHSRPRRRLRRDCTAAAVAAGAGRGAAAALRQHRETITAVEKRFRRLDHCDFKPVRPGQRRAPRRRRVLGPGCPARARRALPNLRLAHPPGAAGAPAILRETTTDTTWESGALPAKTALLIFVPYFHRDPLRLPYADAFTPDSWLDGNSPGDWPLIPFSAGPAECPGRNLVLLVTSALLAALIEHQRLYQIQPRPLEASAPQPVPSVLRGRTTAMTVCPRGGVLRRPRPR